MMGADDPDGVDEDDLCACDECETVAGHYIDLKLAGVRRAALERMVAEGDEVAGDLLRAEHADVDDRSTCRYPNEPGGDVPAGRPGHDAGRGIGTHESTGTSPPKP
jgi:hypothetical protein